MYKKNLIFFTSEYPFGNGEVFIENEIHYLSSAFDTVKIVTNTIKTDKSRIIPDNITTYHFPYELSIFEKFKIVFGIFDLIFWKEIYAIQNYYKIKINFNIIKTILSSIFKGKKLKKYIKINFLTEIKNNEKLWLYSYWLNDMACGLSFLKKDYPELIVFSRAHRWDLYFESGNYNYLPLKTFTINNLNKVYSISDEGASYLKDKIYNVDKNKIITSKIGSFNNEIPVFLYKKNFYLKIISISSIYHVKRIDLLIKSLCLIEDIHFEWIHFGSGWDENKIKNLAEQMLLPKKNCKYEFKGNVANSEIKQYFKDNEIDLFINVSSSEGIPVSIMEAMSFAIPVIATNVGGTSEIVNNKNGFLISSNPEPEEICEKIIKFSQMEINDIEELKENAYNTWNNFYNAENNYPKFIEMILNL